MHSAHGYLLDQFLQDGVNKRTDRYGGSIENRCRFLFEVLDAVLEVYPADRVGVRFAPAGGFAQISDSNPEPLFRHVGTHVDKLGLMYMSVSEPRHQVGVPLDDVSYKMNSEFFKKNFKTPIVAAGGLTPENAFENVRDGKADLVIFGRWYTSNPDLPERIKIGAPLRQYDRSLFYNTYAGARGYSDYPKLSDEEIKMYS